MLTTQADGQKAITKAHHEHVVLRVELVDMGSTLMSTRVSELERQRDELHEESAEVSEQKLRDHLKSALKLSTEKERELVRKEWKQLKGARYSMFEQFPKAVADKRRKLVKSMKDDRDKGKRAWLVYDTLYVDGQPVRE
ncbi:hypothetical protein DPMN_115504 [Dreissena polymorpha]|uniref:Uncharacterized protein n=1 Tax=Dreissena polymorpha TaxID=45954 RepID=A0A9D4KLU6_DREPO|nr:hypothetical protein DPMN_115504 [Dreissena polymorpha]